MNRRNFHAVNAAPRQSLRGATNAPSSSIKPLATAVTLAMVAFSQPSLAANCVWTPANGSWNIAGNWSCGSVPGSGDTASVAFGQTASTTSGSFQGPTAVSNGGTINLTNNSFFAITGSNTNSGAINLQSAGNSTDLQISGLTSIGGTGAVNLGNNVNNRIVATGGPATLTIGSSQTVQGAGQIGAGGALGVVNDGAIIGNLSSGLTINTTSGVTNNNIVRADGAGLTIQNTAVAQGLSGTLDAINGGTLALSNASITGGTFASSGGGAIATSNGTTNSLSGVTNQGTFNVVNNSFVNLTGTLTNNGTTNLQSAGNFTDLVVNGAQSILGNGSINLSNNGNNRIRFASASDTLTIGGLQTLRGSGQIGTGAGSIANAGIMIADQSTPLLINPTNVTNTGILRADGGTLQLQTNVNSGGGSIQALNGSQVQLLNGTTVNNANFTTSGGGLVTTVSGATVGLGGGTVNGSLNVVNNSFLHVTNDVTYNGTLTVSSAGNYTDLSFSGARNLTGTATVQLSNNANNRINSVNGSGDSLTTGANVTIQGSGVIGGSNLAFTNGGTVIASQSSPLLIQSTMPVTNNGVMRADGGTLQIQSTINSAGGSIEAINGSQVQLLNGTVISNANLSAVGAGSLITTVSGATVALAGGAVNGPLNVTNNSFLRLDGNLGSSGGTITLDSAGNYTDIQVNGNRTLNGPLTVDMSNNGNNRILALNGGDTLTIASNVTIQGAGQIGAGGVLNVVNNGTIIGNQTADIAINTSGTFTNNNTIRGDGLNTAVVIGGTTINQGGGGTLNAINNGAIVLQGGAVINGGSLTSASGGVVTTQSGQMASLTGVANNADVNVVNNSFLQLSGALSNNGAINVQSAGNYTDLRVTGGAVTIGGTGSINFSNNPFNRLIGIAGTDSLTLGSGQTLQGSGQIGAGGQFNFTNNGTVVANSAGGMTIDSFGTLLNNHIIRADGASLVINSANTNLGQSATGAIEAINGGTVTLTGNATITGGTLNTASGGIIQTGSGNVQNIVGLTNNGTFNVVNNSALYLNGTITNNGALNVNSVGNWTDLRINGNVTLAGTGTTTISSVSTNRILAANPGDTLTIGAGQTLRGSGAIGALGGLNLVNQGTITANQSNAMIIAVAPTSTVTNAVGGLMQSNTNGTLNLSSAVLNSGTIAAHGGTVNATAGFTGTGTVATSGLGIVTLGASSTAGTILNNGSSATALNLGTHNITVSSDYQNASFGSGNSFNRRANVAGTGQIVAGGDVSQVIAGANVTNGNTANATLTIGNVRVGSNTFNYQIGNAGTTGPTLRGALQTSVNGGNTDDARLSGAGVTASNYNAGGPGGNSGNLAVVFNAASAGALAPLSGQVLNLRSNFENIADQKLNIVLAGGAAAYNAAVGATAPTPVVIANQRVGGAGSQMLTVGNTAAAGAYSEDLGASFGTNTGAATNNGGSLTQLLAGANNNTTMAVGVDTGTAGAKSGTVTLNYETTGTVNGVSNGLGVGGANAPQTITVSGNVYQVAAGALQGNTLNFGTLQVGQQVNQNLVVRNTATGPAGFVEDLNASFGASGNSQITGTGSLNGILAGTNSTGANGTMTVTVLGSTAGALNSGIAVNYFSAGAVNGVGNGLGMLGVGSEQFNVNGTIQAVGNVINQASPQINTPTVTLAARRVGDAAATANVSISNVATVAPQAALNASIATNGAPVTASGSFNLLTPGATDSSSLVVGIGTATAGNFTGGNAGSATISLVSDASNVGNCAPNCQLNLAPQTVTVEGKVYTAAQGTVQGTVNFGIVHVGDVVAAQGVAVQNSAPATALNDTLKASIGGTGGAFTDNGGMVGGLAAGGAANSSALAVGLDTTTAGIYSGNAIVSLASQNPDMADLDLGTANVSLSGQVNKYANAVFDKVSGAGTLSRSGNLFTLDFGNVLLGGALSAILDVDNAVGGGPSDLLDGVLGMNDVSDFTTLLLSSFQNIGADASSGNALSFLFDTNSLGLGTFQDSIDLGWFGHNASGYFDPTRHYTLLVRGNVYTNGGGTVPEPSAALLVLTALAGLALRRRRTGRAC